MSKNIKKTTSSPQGAAANQLNSFAQQMVDSSNANQANNSKPNPALTVTMGQNKGQNDTSMTPASDSQNTNKAGVKSENVPNKTD